MRQVRRQFEQYRLISIETYPHIQQVIHYVRETWHFLKACETDYVRAWNVNYEHVYEVVQERKSGLVILCHLFALRRWIRGYIARDYDSRMIAVYIPDCLGDPVVIDSHAVNDGLVLDNAEKTRLRIPRLWFCCQWSYLHESETEIRQFVIDLSILVQSACQSYRIWKFDSEYFSFEIGVFPFIYQPNDVARKRDPSENFQSVQCQVVGNFRIELEQYRSNECFVHN